MTRPALNRDQRICMFEEFEQRMVLSAQAISQLGIDPALAGPVVQQMESTAEVRTLGHIDSLPEIDVIRNQFGLDGSGQTIAVIDSGIAWDHYALGGGFGSEHKVVGGWDFAENDATPYDDGPAGYHGTHVAGIIASEEQDNPGLSPGADLVSLRVFDDTGQGRLEWVESALSWVHEHRFDFEHPITTVNLSLGADWDATGKEDWLALDDEFAALKADGIFTSVAAGNGYDRLQQNGLSYPAASPHVVAVGSHSATGTVSSFSQRDAGLLVAPGESVRSTVPDHLFGNGTHDRFLGSTGTSMASPYVASASALLREANQLAGVSNINQDLIFRQLVDSADSIWDSESGLQFHRINLAAALEAVLPDQHADQVNHATPLGATVTVDAAGLMGSLNDRDWFQFQATETGLMSLHLQSDSLTNAQLRVQGIPFAFGDQQVSFPVSAGSTYRFAIEAAGGSRPLRGPFDIPAGSFVHRLGPDPIGPVF